MSLMKTKAHTHAKRGVMLMEAAISLTLIAGFLLAWVANLNHQAEQLLQDRYRYETNQALLQQVVAHPNARQAAIIVEGDENHEPMRLEVVEK